MQGGTRDAHTPCTAYLEDSVGDVHRHPRAVCAKSGAVLHTWKTRHTGCSTHITHGRRCAYSTTCGSHKDAHAHARTRTHTHTHTDARTHAHTHTQTHARTHTPRHAGHIREIVGGTHTAFAPLTYPVLFTNVQLSISSRNDGLSRNTGRMYIAPPFRLVAFISVSATATPRPTHTVRLFHTHNQACTLSHGLRRLPPARALRVALRLPRARAVRAYDPCCHVQRWHCTDKTRWDPAASLHIAAVTLHVRAVCIKHSLATLMLLNTKASAPSDGLMNTAAPSM